MFTSPRFLLTLAVGTVALAATGAAPPAHAVSFPSWFDYTVQNRFPGVDAEGIPTEPNTSAYALNQEADVDVTACSSSNSAQANFDWTLDGTRFASGVGICSATKRMVSTDTPHTLGLTITPLGGTATTYRRSVFIKDYLVAGIGDSISSGQGNPERWLGCMVSCGLLSTLRWADSPGASNCDRSTKAGQALAAKQLEYDQHTAVKFVHVGCSGATITKLGSREIDGGDPIDDGGLLASYRGQHRLPDGRQFPPQIDQLADLTCIRSENDAPGVCHGHKRIDALMISIGANDVHFGDFLSFCFSSSCDKAPDNVFLMGRLDDDLKALDRNLDALRDAINTRLNVGKIYLTEYPDPTRGPGGQWVDLPGILGGGSNGSGVSGAEAHFFSDHLLMPLNEHLKTFAMTKNWRFVDQIADAFKDHGYASDPCPFADAMRQSLPVDPCYGMASAQNRWVRTFEEDSYIQGEREGVTTPPSGTAHPNESGHQLIANRLVGAIKQAAPSFEAGTPILKDRTAGGGDVQPGHDFELQLPVRNAGGVETGSLVGTLVTSDPQLSFNQTQSALPSLPAGASGTTTFVGKLAANAGCGTDVGAIVEIASNPGDSFTRPFRWFAPTFQVGATGPVLAGTTTGRGVPVSAEEAESVAGKNGPMVVPGTITVPLAVTGSGPVHDVSVRMDELRVPSIDALTIEIVAPNGRTATVFDGGWHGPVTGPLTQPPRIHGTDMLGATFARNGAALPLSGSAALTGTYAAPGLSVFDGVEAHGNWKLRISNYGGTGVTLKGWGAPIHSAVCIS